MHIDARPFFLLAPSPYIQPIHLLLPTPSDQCSPAARGYQSPSCVGPVKWKMAASERAHFREPSSFEGAWWPLTAAVLTRSPQEHSTAIIVFIKARGEKRGSRGDPFGWCLVPGVAGCLAVLCHGGIVGKHDMGSLTTRWRLCFNMPVELLVNTSFSLRHGDVFLFVLSDEISNIHLSTPALSFPQLLWHKLLIKIMNRKTLCNSQMRSSFSHNHFSLSCWLPCLQMIQRCFVQKDCCMRYKGKYLLRWHVSIWILESQGVCRYLRIFTFLHASLFTWICCIVSLKMGWTWGHSDLCSWTTQNWISLFSTASGHFCQIWKNFFSVFVRYQVH